MESFYAKFKSGFKKTNPNFYKLFGKVGGVFSGKQLDNQSLEELEEALYGADFGVETTTEVIDEIKAVYAKDKSLRGEEAAKIGSRGDK